MKLHLSEPLYSATDLLNFLGCTHATALDMEMMRGALADPKSEDDAYLAILKEKGLEHERAYLARLKAEGKSVVEVTEGDPIDVKAERTRQAMRDGVDVIYQGTLTAPGWLGYSDFLLRTETKSNFGEYSYEVADTKLARKAKPKHVVQLCIYSELIHREQGVYPEHAYVVLGDNSELTVRLRDYLYYSGHAKERFASFVAGDKIETVAERCPHCGLCRWAKRCDEEWETDGNLRIVAALGSLQAAKLRTAGVTTIEQLAHLSDSVTIPKIHAPALERLRSQARLQMVKRTTDENVVEVLPILERRGLFRLPEPAEGDLFFDMEGDPVYSPQGSLEYLFGFHHLEDGKDTYTAFWARDKAGERKAFEDALDFITMRLAKYPQAYVYHYAAYEQTALKRLASEYGGSSRHQDAIKELAQSYGTRENEVDDLLRDRKFVDLYKVVREAIQTSEPAYSLKNLEVFFAPKRTEEIKSGGDSIVAFEKWIKSGDDELLHQIEVYNEFDCLSTRLCRDWLVSLRPGGVTWFDPKAERAAEELERDKKSEEKRRLDDARILTLRADLLRDADGGEREWRELLGYLLEFHRREARAEWQEYFKRTDSAADLINDADCIGGMTLDPSHTPVPVKQSRVWRLKFPEQEFKITVDSNVCRSDNGKSVEIVALSTDERWVDVKMGNKQDPFGSVVGLIPGGPLNDAAIRAAISRYAEAVVAGQADRFAAVTSILRKEIPGIADGAPIIPHGADQLHGTIDAIARMDGTHLVIQGPPGSGKTFTSAHAIVSLIEKGKRVGVMSMSHKAINNLLQGVDDIAAKRGIAFRGIKKSGDGDQHPDWRMIVETDANEEIEEGDHAIVGGTSWLFSRPAMDGKLDYLFVDEAGQVPLANIVATGLAAKNIVLVGDQMQLSHPGKSKHPGGSGVSGLDYLMGNLPTVPEDRGVFLEHTWRMHPHLCRFISDAFYESRLESHKSTEQQQLDLNDDCNGILAATGLRYVAVEHDDNSQQSIEEATQLDTAYRCLLGQSWVDQHGEMKPIAIGDILVVSPFNMQVNLLKATLPAGARVGTVDKFQGQEAAVVLVSMASSSADYIPRGIEFLFSKNRLNVALSRARCLSVMFCSPRLLDVVCTDLARMNLVNTVCWAEQYAFAQQVPQSAI